MKTGFSGSGVAGLDDPSGGMHGPAVFWVRFWSPPRAMTQPGERVASDGGLLAPRRIDLVIPDLVPGRLLRGQGPADLR